MASLPGRPPFRLTLQPRPPVRRGFFAQCDLIFGVTLPARTRPQFIQISICADKNMIEFISFFYLILIRTQKKPEHREVFGPT